MLAAAGASINSMPSSEIYTGLQTGVLDAVNTSSGSFVSYRIYEQVDCLTPPGDFALWFMYEPILMSKESFESLDAGAAAGAAGRRAEGRGLLLRGGPGPGSRSWSRPSRRRASRSQAMSQDQFNAWLDLAKGSSYKIFAEEVPGGDAADREGARGRVSSRRRAEPPAAMADPVPAREARVGPQRPARSVHRRRSAGSRSSAASQRSGFCSPRCW